jgi:hypothetical protein
VKPPASEETFWGFDSDGVVFVFRNLCGRSGLARVSARCEPRTSETNHEYAHQRHAFANRSDPDNDKTWAGKGGVARRATGEQFAKKANDFD